MTITEEHTMRVVGGDVRTWSPDSPTEVEEARAYFQMLVAQRRYNAYTMDPQRPDVPGEKTEQFDPVAGEYMIVPSLSGG